ncbi:phage antirepressor N-terminal domain-containing protein [Singulisphaera sp. PoT]|uniref:phage antirepressor N-terminal domain-containing protein n=1 Tax=Singulisphaera sp. PoT TaxID=3411797 RepID=UPI003BF5E384
MEDSKRSPKLELVPFYGDSIEAIRDGNGDAFVVIKRICENLGVTFAPQFVKLKNLHWAGVSIIEIPDSRGSLQETCVLPLNSLPMWLANIYESKVAEHIRPKLRRYQLEARDALARWAGLSPSAARPQLEEIVRGLADTTKQAVEQLQSAQAAAALRLEAAEGKLNVIQGLGLARQAGWQTLTSFARERGIVFEGNQAQLEGKNASEIAKSMAIELGRKHDGPEAGNRTYPTKVLERWLSGYLARVHQQKRERELNIFAG